MALQLAPEYRDIADKLIDKFPVAFGFIELDKVLFLKEDSKTPKKYADIRGVRSPFTFMTEYKFIMTVYEQVCASMNDAQKVMLIYHELLHIHSDFEKLRKHNLEDFRELVAIYGVNWNIDPNLPNILDDDQEGPLQPVAEEDEEEPEV